MCIPLSPASFRVPCVPQTHLRSLSPLRSAPPDRPCLQDKAFCRRHEAIPPGQNRPPRSTASYRPKRNGLDERNTVGIREKTMMLLPPYHDQRESNKDTRACMRHDVTMKRLVRRSTAGFPLRRCLKCKTSRHRLVNQARTVAKADSKTKGEWLLTLETTQRLLEQSDQYKELLSLDCFNGFVEPDLPVISSLQQLCSSCPPVPSLLRRHVWVELDCSGQRHTHRPRNIRFQDMRP